jgi:hypothetical protein
VVALQLAHHARQATGTDSVRREGCKLGSDAVENSLRRSTAIGRTASITAANSESESWRGGIEIVPCCGCAASRVMLTTSQLHDI